MSRALPYRLECTEKCLQAQDDALNSTFFILRQTGPTAFVIKDDERTFKVYLGDQHQCSCSTFQRDQELCKHICWLLLKRFRIPRTNPMIWQKGLVEREINEILHESQNNDERNKSNRANLTKNEDETDVDNEVEQRSMGDNDVCPICQEEFLSKNLPITYCRRGCGNNVHIKCMKVWMDHQVSIGEQTIKCPLCRETFGTPEQLKKEFRTSNVEQAEKASIHLGYACHRCHLCPISGKCYKCTTCQDYFLCQICFNLNIHKEHSFDYREKSFQRWKMATREHLTALPNALYQMLSTRDIVDDDYEILLQLENAQTAAIISVPENVVKALPSERINEQSQLFQTGEQCRLCLRFYQIGERARRLPCKHKFHIDCIDGWLLHSHSTCPIDGQLIWSTDMNNEQQPRIKRSSSNISRTTRKPPPVINNSPLLSIDMGLTIRPYQIRTRTTSDLSQRFRRLHMRAPLRPLISSMSVEMAQPLEINTRNSRSRQTSFLLSNNNEQRQFRRSFLDLEENQRTNIDYEQRSTLSTDSFDYRLRPRRRSNVK